jgi:hypothetical protein
VSFSTTAGRTKGVLPRAIVLKKSRKNRRIAADPALVLAGRSPRQWLGLLARAGEERGEMREERAR